ncbi:MAG: rlmN 2 [Candidatus Aminicenantes bacterium]|nr:rlmN 2 [Candidatus Aminicenantes bacterium]
MPETDGRVNILGLTRPAFEALAGRRGHSRALGRVYRRAFAEGRFEPGAEGIAKATAAALAARVMLWLPAVEGVVEEAGPFGTTAKALLRLEDGQRVECVRIPVARRVPEPGPATLCVSSQVGCRMGCVFCESGRRGFVRDLRPEEIVGQYAAARLSLGWDIGQIVFMGMGEPLDNFEGLAGALAVLLEESGPAFSQDDLTVCTVGLPDGIARLRGLGLKRLNLSVSLRGRELRGPGRRPGPVSPAPQFRARGELLSHPGPERRPGRGGRRGGLPPGRGAVRPVRPQPHPLQSRLLPHRTRSDRDRDRVVHQASRGGRRPGQAAKPPGPCPHGGLRPARAPGLAAAPTPDKVDGRAMDQPQSEDQRE